MCSTLFRTAPHGGIVDGLYIPPGGAEEVQDGQGTRPATTATTRYTPPITPINVAAQQDIYPWLLFYVGGTGAGTRIVHEEENKAADPYDPNTRRGFGGVCACATVDEIVRSRLSIGIIEGACNRRWIHLDIRATRSRCELTMAEVRSDLEARLSRYQSQTYS